MNFTLFLFVLVFTALAYFVALLVEAYKKYLRKDKSGDLENKAVAFLLSAVFSVVLYFVFDMTELVDDGISGSPFVIVIYSVCLYLLQKPACLAYWKPLFKRLIERKVS